MHMKQVVLLALNALEDVLHAMLHRFAMTAFRVISSLMIFAVEIVSIILMYLLNNAITALKVAIIVIILLFATYAFPIISSLMITVVVLASSM